MVWLCSDESKGDLTSQESRNVFILNAGRCGSTTFIMACRQITNYTCAHQSRAGYLAEDRFPYPENHIEADNCLFWMLGRLDEVYGDNAVYVHLMREKEDTALSYARRHAGGIMQAYMTGIVGVSDRFKLVDVVADYYDTVNSNISLFLKGKTHKLVFGLDDMERGFVQFWNPIGAEGEMDSALAEFGTRCNAFARSEPDPTASVLGVC